MKAKGQSSTDLDEILPLHVTASLTRYRQSAFIAGCDTFQRFDQSPVQWPQTTALVETERFPLGDAEL